MAEITYGDERSGRLARESVQRAWRSTHAPSRQLDPVLLVAALGLACFGLLMIYSATFHELQARSADGLYYVNRQVLSLALGLLSMTAVTLVDYRTYRAWAPLVYGGALALLVLVLLVGTEVNASRSWLVVGGFQLQPSEVAKPALILILAALFQERREEALGLRALGEALALAAVPMLLILAQPDLGTFLVFVAIVFGVLLLARVRVRYMVALAIIGLLASLGALQLGIVKDYQVERLTAFLNPDAADALGAAYNVNQSQIAIGAGQFLGQGLFRGSQTSLAYVPENHTDFIFTVIGEELGFLGAAAMLALFALLIWRGLRIAALSRDTFGTLLAGGVVSVLGFQLFVNVGMAIGLMPVAGLPLPLVSYGGTSLITTFVMLGLLQNVHMRRFS
ncbi:MAG TPA: rod shape-determining protein RodA [Egibacteraceae bacterium]|nr:rod shape-determining protein RodA [Egibacteraceae bacterium]